MQSGKDAECVLFQKIAEQGHYAGRTVPSATRQGTYATTADGRLLASWNNNNPRHVAGKLREALEVWEKIQRGEDSEADVEAIRFDVAELNRQDRFYPEGGLVLRVNTRDLPREVPLEGRWADSWNQDFAWFKKEEARQFLPENPEAGQEHPVPQELVERLARFHLLDNVRGQTSPFPASAVKEASLTSRVTEVVGDEVVLRLEGKTRTEHEGRWSIRGFRDMNQPQRRDRGMETELLGFARFDLKAGRFVHFEVVAVGQRWGGTLRR